MFATADSPIVAPTRLQNGPAVALIAWIMALALIALWATPMALWAVREGVLVDADDAMRLVQLRDWLNGAGWFDVTQYRIDPPTGALMHWPRLIELPLAGLILAAEPFAGRDLAERLVVGLWPMVLLAALVFLLIALARRLVAPPALLATAVVIAFNPVLQFQLAPGRIDHHGVQMLLSVGLAIATIGALADGRRRAAVAAGMLAALMLAIGLETVPLIATACALFGIGWVVRGEAVRPPLVAFGCAFAAAALALFLATVPPSRWTEVHADVLSLPWLWLAVGGGLALSGLGAIVPPARALHRAGWTIAAGIAVSAIVVAFWPHVLAGPLADVDPLVRKYWLEGVGEARPLAVLVARDPGQFLSFLAFPAIGWLGLCIAAWRGDARRPAFLVLLAFGSVGLAMAIGALRGAPFASLYALFGWLALIDFALAPLALNGTLSSKLAGALAAAVLIVLALPFGWSLLGDALRDAPEYTTPVASCGVREDLAGLAAKPAGLVLAPLRLGPRVLVATDHSVLGAPYHRINAGNRFVLETFMADPATARENIRAHGIRYVALCLADVDLAKLVEGHPDSFLAGLMQGSPYASLAPLPWRGPMRLWSVIP